MVTYALTSREFANRLFEFIVDPLIALLAFTALLLFIWTGISLIRNQKESGDRAVLFKRMGIVILGLFVIFSVWTIFSFIGRLAGSDIVLEKETVEFAPFDILKPKNPSL